jgi:hypothetical protein
MLRDELLNESDGGYSKPSNQWGAQDGCWILIGRSTLYTEMWDRLVVYASSLSWVERLWMVDLDVEAFILEGQSGAVLFLPIECVKNETIQKMCPLKLRMVHVQPHKFRKSILRSPSNSRRNRRRWWTKTNRRQKITEEKRRGFFILWIQWLDTNTSGKAGGVACGPKLLWLHSSLAVATPKELISVACADSAGEGPQCAQNQNRQTSLEVFQIHCREAPQSKLTEYTLNTLRTLIAKKL